jgi:nucleoid-associated protein YgaU
MDLLSEPPIEMQFNPTMYSLSKTNKWQPVNMTSANVPKAFFKGGDPTTIKLELLFDTYSSNAKGQPLDNPLEIGDPKLDVRAAYTDKIYKLTLISDKLKQQNKTPRPPQVLFSWGQKFEFHSVITSFSVQYTMFASNGIPVRAKISLTMQECQDPDAPPPGQNPSSQGTWGHKVYTVKPGDTIDRIAYHEYGDSTLWRAIADSNDLFDPMELAPGQQLAIEPLNLLT